MDPAGFEPASATVTECCVPLTLRALSGVFRGWGQDRKVMRHNFRIRISNWECGLGQ